jgi:NADPH:quinone reductase-like Zn-dependent oxidoreductase
VKAPSNLTAEEASTLPIAGLTAWEAITKVGGLKAGQTVLLQGTGGVSVFALQFAKAMGARVIITSGSDEKLLKAKALGADKTINYKTNKNWHEEIAEITGGKGVDLALEISWAEISKTMQAMKTGGKIVVVGLLGGSNTDLSVFCIMQKCLSILGVHVGPKMVQAIEVNNLKPVVDKVFQLSEFAEAMHYFKEARHFGKVVVKF